MFALYVALLAAVWMSSMEGVEAQNYTVHSSVIFARTGDRMPILGVDTPHLTTLGAQQMYNLGAYFRRRYITAYDENPLDGAVVLTGLSSWDLNNDQIFIQTTDTMYTAQSAQSFMQALYPPFVLANSTAPYLDPTSILADGTYVKPPLNGYQYAVVNTVSEFDPYSVYIDGATDCPNFDESALQYYSSADFNTTDSHTDTMYQSIGHAVLDSVLPQSEWGYENAYLIWDYVTYMNTHDPTTNNILSGDAYRGDIDQLGALASHKQFQIYGNLSESYVYPGDEIRATAGKTLAARILGMMLDNVASEGEANKVNLFVGEYPPMLGLFSLMQLTEIDDLFKNIPPFAGGMAFELFSWENGTGVTDSDGANYPDQSDLWVRFLYVNGSLGIDNADLSIQSYPLFQMGPSETDIPWNEFQALISNVMMAEISDWCNLCSSGSIFCAALDNETTTTTTTPTSDKDMTPKVAGVIGAAVTLGTLSIALILAMLFGGVRFTRPDSSKKHELGGFKGSSKLASDQDLHLPKNAAPIGITTTDADTKKGHERVGSWELNDAAAKGMETQRNTFGSLGGSTVTSFQPDKHGRPSYEKDEEQDQDGINPFEGPVRPRESI